jgi:5-enolpyruvylshikimate-3-phosphate synthase
MNITTHPPYKLEGAVQAPPSKSYTHRALFVAAISALITGKESIIENISVCKDNINTMKFFTDLGVQFIVEGPCVDMLVDSKDALQIEDGEPVKNDRVIVSRRERHP